MLNRVGWVFLPAGADLTLEPDLAQLELQIGVVEGHDVGILLAEGAVAARRRLLPALALPQVQPAHTKGPFPQMAK